MEGERGGGNQENFVVVIGSFACSFVCFCINA